MTIDRRAARAFVAGHRAAAARKNELLRAEGPRIAHSIELSLSMIDAANTAGPFATDPVREAGVRDVRRTWRKLRARLG